MFLRRTERGVRRSLSMTYSIPPSATSTGSMRMRSKPSRRSESARQKAPRSREGPQGPQAPACANQDRRAATAAFANTADHMRIKGMGKNYRAVARGRREYGPRAAVPQPGHLAKAMAEANKKRKMVRFLPSGSSSSAGSRREKSCRSRSPTDNARRHRNC